MGKKGFTLVELSIVLVIIGLLISGILVAKSMIETAKINKIITQIQQYDIAITNFYNKFKQYPGDSSYFDPPGTPDKILNSGDEDNDGNEDGLACKNGGPYTNLEYVNAWAHLSQSTMLSKTYVPWAPDNCGGSHPSDYNDASVAGIIQPYIEVSQDVATFISMSTKPAISIAKNYNYSNIYIGFSANPLDAAALDEKMGAQNYDSSNAQIQIGLVNMAGKGNCFTNVMAIVKCGDSNAMYGSLAYYIKPE